MAQFFPGQARTLHDNRLIPLHIANGTHTEHGVVSLTQREKQQQQKKNYDNSKNRWYSDKKLIAGAKPARFIWSVSSFFLCPQTQPWNKSVVLLWSGTPVVAFSLHWRVRWGLEKVWKYMEKVWKYMEEKVENTRALPSNGLMIQGVSVSVLFQSYLWSSRQKTGLKKNTLTEIPCIAVQ